MYKGQQGLLVPGVLQNQPLLLDLWGWVGFCQTPHFDPAYQSLPRLLKSAGESLLMMYSHFLRSARLTYSSETLECVHSGIVMRPHSSHISEGDPNAFVIT